MLWFRHGLRLHDNPTLHEAVERMRSDPDVLLLPLFIFDGESAGTGLCGYNRFQFLLECLRDLDEQLRAAGSRLYLARGRPEEVLDALHEDVGVKALCLEQVREAERLGGGQSEVVVAPAGLRAGVEEARQGGQQVVQEERGRVGGEGRTHAMEPARGQHTEKSCLSLYSAVVVLYYMTRISASVYYHHC